jgi:hypothetical protein
VSDAAQTAEGLGHRFDDVPRAGKPGLALAHDNSAVHFNLEAPGMAPDQRCFHAERVSQCLSGSRSVGKVVAGDAVDDGDHGVRV